MKPFELDEFIKNPSKEVTTRNGDKVRIICTDKIGEYPVVALVNIDGIEIVQTYTELGHIALGDATNLDLFFASVKREGWIAIYRDSNGKYFCGINVHETEVDARKMNVAPSAIVKIEWVE